MDEAHGPARDGEPARKRARRTPTPPANASLTELEVLQGISRAFGSTPDVDEAAAAAVRWVRAAVGSDHANVRVFLLGPDGRVHPVAPRIEVADDPDRQAARREIFLSRRPARSPLGGEQTLVTLPLLTRGEPVGVIEVSAATLAVEERWATLEAVASQVAILFRNLLQRSALNTSLEGTREMGGLAGEMVRAASPEEAVRAAVRFCHRRLGRPAAGWLAGADSTRLELVSAHGLGTERGRQLRSHMRVLRGRDLRTGEDRREFAERFAELAGMQDAEAAVVGSAVLVAGGSSSTGNAPLRMVETLLEDVLAHLSLVADARRRHERLDLGIALTAHEVRAPLVGAMASLERLIADHGNVEDQTLLRRSREQLEDLSKLVEGLLRWAVSGRPLDLVPTDLVGLVRAAVDACSRETDTDRVTVSAPSAVTVLADPGHLQAAIANVVRNAINYSPPTTTVSVEVRPAEGQVTVSVRDSGPGVPPSESEFIFDPFMRGSASHLVRSGNGLGLFIARRVMEAHGGSIWLTSNGTGAVFRMRLPLAAGGAPSGF